MGMVLEPQRAACNGVEEETEKLCLITGQAKENMAASSSPHHPSEFSLFRATPSPFHHITNAAALRLRHFLRHGFAAHRHHLGLILHSSFQNIAHIGHVFRLEEVWPEKSLQLRGLNLLQRSSDAWESTCSSCLYFFSGKENGRNYGDEGKPFMESPTGGSANGRQLTNIILAINVLVYLAQISTQGKLMLWGAKVNSLIDKGQIWRLATSSLLHANIGHLLVNSYSLNSIGPSVENLCGRKRYLVVYMTSAIASSAMSYWLSKAPAVGASGAIFGLVGSFAMFAFRHNNLVKGGVGDLQHVARVIALNIAIGLLTPRIDNWGHIGGLLGGIATSWLIGPAWEFEQSSRGRSILVDKAPIFTLTGRNRASQ